MAARRENCSSESGQWHGQKSDILVFCSDSYRRLQADQGFNIVLHQKFPSTLDRLRCQAGQKEETPECGED